MSVEFLTTTYSVDPQKFYEVISSKAEVQDVNGSLESVDELLEKEEVEEEVTLETDKGEITYRPKNGEEYVELEGNSSLLHPFRRR